MKFIIICLILVSASISCNIVHQSDVANNIIGEWAITELRPTSIDSIKISLQGQVKPRIEFTTTDSAYVLVNSRCYSCYTYSLLLNNEILFTLHSGIPYFREEHYRLQFLNDSLTELTLISKSANSDYFLTNYE